MASRLPGCPPAVWSTYLVPGPDPVPSPALSSSTRALQPSDPTATSTAHEAVEAVVGRRALLVTNAENGGPAGEEVDGGDLWRGVLGLGIAGRVADGRDAPVEGAGKHSVRGVRESIQRGEARGQGVACRHAYGARALKLGGWGNTEPLTSGCRSDNRSGSPSACCCGLRQGDT